MNKSTKQRNMELLGLTEGAKLKSLQNDTFKHLGESYEAQEKDEITNQKDTDMTIEEFEQKSFEAREEDAELYDLTNETFEIEIEYELLAESFDNFKTDAVDDMEDALINNYDNITTEKVRSFIKEFISFLDTSDALPAK
ncbi:MAG: hypothetical protein P8J32_05950 [bacterium]|nr:hypothetical protein [bacterium]